MKALALAALAATLSNADPAPAPTPAPTTPAPTSSASAPAQPAAADAQAKDVHVMDEKEMVELQQSDNVRLSLPTESEQEAWDGPGLRVQLGYGFGLVHGVGPAWSFNSHTLVLHPGVRLDRFWSVGATMLYGSGPNGLRWSVTAEPTFHPWKKLGLSVGLGYGGLLVSDQNRNTGRLRGPDETVSRELVDGETLQSCDGAGISSLARAEYLFVAGAMFSTGPFAQANVQWTKCGQNFGRVDRETGKPIVLSQLWRQQGATFGWWFSWR